MTRDAWAEQIREYRTLCPGLERCGHPEWHRLAEEWDGGADDGGRGG